MSQLPSQTNSMVPSNAPQRRKRGGQPGNANAFKHGHYMKSYQFDTSIPLNPDNLKDINKMIMYIKDYFVYTYEHGFDCKDMHEVNGTLRSLSIASISLVRLISIYDNFLRGKFTFQKDDFLDQLLN